jgi:hypothetical protein
MKRAASVNTVGPIAEMIQVRDDYKEIPTWIVSICDEDDREIKSYRCTDYYRAMSLADKIAKDRRIENAWEASPAY